MGLPYDYTGAVLYAIDKIGQGYTITAACDEANINVPTFNNYIQNNSVLQEQFDDAQQRSYDAMADALLNPDNHDMYGHSDPKMAKVQSDNIKWFLSKKKPKEYGDRITVDHTITADKAIIAALVSGRKRANVLTYDEDMNLIPDAEIVEDDESIMAQLLS